jgi:predicted metal-dependent hydrolase
VISTQVKSITANMNALLIPAKIENDKIMKKVEKFFRDTAKQVIGDRCAYFSDVLKLRHASAGTNNNKTRWGCCTRTGEIAINWRAIFLRPDVLDYIIVHEFCHLLEFNHTKNFWAVVETILPNWRKLRLELKRLSWLLQLFRD